MCVVQKEKYNINLCLEKIKVILFFFIFSPPISNLMKRIKDFAQSLTDNNFFVYDILNVLIFK